MNDNLILYRDLFYGLIRWFMFLGGTTLIWALIFRTLILKKKL